MRATLVRLGACLSPPSQAPSPLYPQEIEENEDTQMIGGKMGTTPELSDEKLSTAIPMRVRARLRSGRFETGDIKALRCFVGLTQDEFARALRISVDTLQNWEQGRRPPQGPSIALLRAVAHMPGLVKMLAD